MRRTFNLGIGLVAVVSPVALEEVKGKATELNENVIEIGKVV
jgi:phosphoribosylaminoimidazole (AIR) synthetase